MGNYPQIEPGFLLVLSDLQEIMRLYIENQQKERFQAVCL